MTEKELKESVYEAVAALAVTLVREHKTLSTEELTKWINTNYPDFKYPYGDCRGVPQAAFRRAKISQNQEAMDALVKAFTSVGGNSLWHGE